MTRIITTVMAATLAITAWAGAQAADSKAKSWGLSEEQKARFEAKVVDILCELSGDCPANCGAGTRQLGLLNGEGRLILANKNTQRIFSGAVEDLLPYCGKMVEVDGLFAGHSGTQVYQVQFIKEADAEKFRKANRWSKVWRKTYPEAAKKKGRWYRKDPRIKPLIERDGYLGLGLATDKAFIDDY